MMLLGLIACFTLGDGPASDRLLAEGYTDIELSGNGWLSCSRDDIRSRKFTARRATGHPVAGTVCCGWFGECYLRNGPTLRLELYR